MGLRVFVGLGMPDAWSPSPSSCLSQGTLQDLGSAHWQIVAQVSSEGLSEIERVLQEQQSAMRWEMGCNSCLLLSSEINSVREIPGCSSADLPLLQLDIWIWRGILQCPSHACSSHAAHTESS